MLSPLCTRGAAASRRSRSSLCLIAYNRAFLIHSARIALWPLPGDGLSHPGSVPPHPNCAAALGKQRDAAPILRSHAGQQNQVESFTEFYNPPCMAAPCCPPFAQGRLFFAWVDTTGPFCVTGLGLHPGPCRGWPASPGARLQTTHTAWESFGSGDSPLDFWGVGIL